MEELTKISNDIFDFASRVEIQEDSRVLNGEDVACTVLTLVLEKEKDEQFPFTPRELNVYTTNCLRFFEKKRLREMIKLGLLEIEITIVNSELWVDFIFPELSDPFSLKGLL